MTFCGYHPDMAAGLLTFGRGVAISTIEKARLAGRTIDEHVEVELDLLGVLVEEITRAWRTADSQDRERLNSLEASAMLCRSCFLGAKGKVTTGEDLTRHFEATFTEYGSMIRRLEDGFEGCPEGTDISDRTRAGIQAALVQTKAVKA